MPIICKTRNPRCSKRFWVSRRFAKLNNWHRGKGGFGRHWKIALTMKTIRLCICVQFHTPSQCICRVNTALIDKDSQCIYQLFRLNTLSHWSLPWSGGGGDIGGTTGSRKRGTAVILKRAIAHVFLSPCNRFPLVSRTLVTPYCEPLRYAVIQSFTPTFAWQHTHPCNNI